MSSAYQITTYYYCNTAKAETSEKRSFIRSMIFLPSNDDLATFSLSLSLSLHSSFSHHPKSRCNGFPVGSENSFHIPGRSKCLFQRFNSYIFFLFLSSCSSCEFRVMMAGNNSFSFFSGHGQPRFKEFKERTRFICLILMLFIEYRPRQKKMSIKTTITAMLLPRQFAALTCRSTLQ